jgi:F0F1-type ATP synthase membrane subunit b/b'
MFSGTIFELNLTYFIFIVMFLLFMQALNKVFLEPVGQAIEKRKALLKNRVDEGASARAQANELVEAHERELREERIKAQALITEVTTRAQNKRNAELKDVLESGQTKLSTAKKDIEGEKSHLIAQLVEDEKTIVTTIVQKLLGSSVAVNLDNSTIQHVLVAEESR